MTLPAERTRPTLTVWQVALLLPWITAVIAARLPIRDNSFLWHVGAGRLQVERAEVLTTDPFSYTFAGTPWRTQSWLVELLYGFFDVRSGLQFVTPFLAVTAALTFALILVVAFRHTGSVVSTAVVGVMSAWLSAAFLSPRPVVLSYLLLALVVAACTDRRLRWTLPLLIWTWAGIHGSFVLGIGYVVLSGLRRGHRRWPMDGVAMAVVATLTAHGVGIWLVLIEFATSQGSLDLITEWATPDFTKVALVPFLAGLLLLVVSAMRGNLGRAELWVVFPFVVFAMTATRAVFPAWIALAPHVASAVVGLPVTRRRTSREQRVLTLIAVALLAFPFALPVKDASELSPEFPTDAVSWLTAEVVFHDDYVGGYLIYRYGTGRPVFIDDRAELYGESHFRSMIEARNGMPGWQALFEQWGVEQALVRSDDGLADALREAGWVLQHADEVFEVYGRPT